MKQLSFLEDGLPLKGVAYRLEVDGASRGNPGKSGIGICIKRNGKKIEEHGFSIGTATNNQAEYMALLVGLYYVMQHIKPIDTLAIVSDSQLLIRQIAGQYAVKNEELKRYFQRVKKLIDHISYTVHHVMREQNVCADRLANKGIDDAHALPEVIKQFMLE